MTQPAKSTTKLADASNKGQIGNQGSAIVDHSFVFTTDDPGLTAADATTIADGDATIVLAEMLQMGADLSAKLNAVIAVLESHGLIAG